MTRSLVSTRAQAPELPVLSDDDRPQCSSHTAHQTSGSEPSSAAAGLPFQTPWGTVGKWELLGSASAAFQKGQAPASFVSGFGGQRQQDLSQEAVGLLVRGEGCGPRTWHWDS